jgi:hypothetical protein
MFKKPSELWKDDADMAKADSSKQTYVPFVFPELILSEYVMEPIIDPATGQNKLDANKKPMMQKKMDANGKPLTQNYNVFERLIDIAVKLPEGKAILKANKCLDLDKIWEKFPQFDVWRKHIPQGKTLNLMQMFPTPYAGRKLYYSFLLFVQDAEWESKETDQLDDKGKKIKKNQKKPLVNENGEPIMRLGGYMPNRSPKKGGQIEIWVNTWHLEEHNERIQEPDEQGNMKDKVIKKVGKEMEYWRTKGYINEQKGVDYFLQLEKAAFEQQAIQPDFDKPYLWFLTTEVKPLKNPSVYASHDTTIDAFYLTK